MSLRQYLYTGWVWGAACVVSFFWGSLSLAASCCSKDGTLPHYCMRVWAGCCLAITSTSLHVEGLEKLAKQTKYIIVANHSGVHDILVLCKLLPVRFSWVSKEKNFRIPFIGWHLRRTGCISIDESNRREGYDLLQAAAEALSRDIPIVFFPEGTRSKDGTLRPFQSGAFRLAERSLAPIVPITIEGSWTIISPRTLLAVRGVKLYVRIGEAIEPLPDQTASELKNKTFAVIEKNLVELQELRRIEESSP